jgi:hypothetical protein
MCNTGKHAGSVAPEVELAKLIKDSLDIDVHPGVLRLFIKAEWSAITKAAHAIHGRDAGRIKPGIKTADGPNGAREINITPGHDRLYPDACAPIFPPGSLVD